MSSAPRVSGVVLALNAAPVIDDCLASLQWVDEIVVLVDAATTDDTTKRSRAHGARVHARRFTTFAEQRNAALDLAESDWVLFVDSDERVPPELAEEVRREINGSRPATGYWIPRQNIIRGRWIKHAGWYPDHQLRLLQRAHARYPTNNPVHEVATLEGPAETLTTPLIHLNYRTLGEFWQRQRKYAHIAAQGMRLRGERPRARAILGQPLREFHRRYIQQQGYREGPLGLALCLMTTAGVFETYVRAVLGTKGTAGT